MQTAQIITSYGRQYIVRDEHGQTFQATTRKKRVDYACGDQVKIQSINAEQVVIEDFLPRQSLLYRQDAFKSKLIAANVTQLLIVVAAEPSPNEMLVQRALLAAEAGHIQAHIVLNKSDLEGTAKWQKVFQYYAGLGYGLSTLSALNSIEDLRPILKGHSNIFLGQSGMGKSTLTNAILGENIARTGDISTALDSGKHTTTHAQLYQLDEDTQLIDSPGLQAFGLHHLDKADLLHYFPDMRHLIGECRFHNCSHYNEPNCAVKNATETGSIPRSRLNFLQMITKELSR